MTITGEPWEGVGPIHEVVHYINNGAKDRQYVNTPEKIAGKFAFWMTLDVVCWEFEDLEHWLKFLREAGARFIWDEALVIAKLLVAAHQRSNL